MQTQKETTQNGIKYISLDEINRYYTKAVYDSEKSAVIPLSCSG